MKLVSLIVFVTFIVIAGFLAFSYFSPDYALYTVRSGSMQPSINVGDMIVTGPPAGPLNGDIKPGTIVTYAYNKGLVTHRVVAVNGDNLVTKGDYLEEPDPKLVSMSKIKGVYLFKVPYIGYVSSFAATKQGWFLTIVLPSILLVAWIIKDIIKESLSYA